MTMCIVENCLKIDVEVWKNRGMWAWNRDTILGVFLGGWKIVVRWKRGTMQKIRSSIVLLPTPPWHYG